MEVYHSAGMRRTSNWLIKNVIIAFLRAFIELLTAPLATSSIEEWLMESLQVSRAVDNAAARLGESSC